MDENAWAKSNPKEDIQHHTNNLLANLNILKELYPNLMVDWGLLRWACVYHDLGKLHFKFQERIKRIKRYADEIPHGLLSLAFIDHQALKKAGYKKEDIKLLFHAVAYHHDREMPYEIEDIEREFAGLLPSLNSFEYQELPSKAITDEIDQRYFILNQRFYESDGIQFFRFIMLEGLLNRLDYAASAGVPVETSNDFLENALEDMMKHWQQSQPDTHWNELQLFMRDNADQNVVVIAQTGMGKTEAGLLWLGNAKGFFTLPLKSAINAIYKRLKLNIIQDHIEERIGMLHSDTYIKYLEQSEADDNIAPDIYYTRTRQLSLPLTICTLDQLFGFVFRYRGFEQKLATLSYSKIIIDEVQMYSPELLAYLILGLHYITHMGGKFAIMTATLPSFFLDLLKEQRIEYAPQQVFTNEIIRHSLKVLDQEINAQTIMKLNQQYNGKKILVICNTVKSAVKMYRDLVKLLEESEGFDYRTPTSQLSDLIKPVNEPVRLLHSCFTKEDRAFKESDILELGQRKNLGSGIWVTTQIVEASLDLDFDLLFTELSDLNGLFQRMGRCYRGRILDIEYNCFVFTGGGKHCSGVGQFIDKEIHRLSKAALLNIDGIIGEAQKIKLVEELYTKDNLPEYYYNIQENIQYVQSFSAYELSKSEVDKRFRNIDTVSVIPRSIYNHNLEIINEAIEDLQKDYQEIEKSKARALRANARSKIANYTVDISNYLAKQLETTYIKINEYERIIVVECGYDSKEGIIKPELKQKDAEFFERLF